MTTVINGSSPSITFSDSTTQTTAGLPLTGGTLSGAVTVPTLNAPSGVLATQNGMTGIAKAWVQASSAGVIAGSFNVSSVTRNSAGDYTINFTTSMANANYAFNTSVVGPAARYIWSGTPATASINVVIANTAQVATDTAFCTIVCGS
jgi:hypothetical protein